MLAQVDYIPDSLAPWGDDPRWWLRSSSYQDPRLVVCGIPLPEIVEHLRLVYTESVCQQMVLDGLWAPLLGLFTAASWSTWFGIMLALGVDLHRLGAERLGPYGARLHTGEHWWGARLEIGVEAGLRRIGHDPRRPDLPSHTKQWDFSDEQDGAPLLFECKALSPGDGDGNFDLVEQRFQNLGAVFQHEHRVDALLCFSPSMLREIHERRPQTPFIEGNVDRTFRFRKTSLKLDRRRLKFDRAVLLGIHRPFESPEWLTDSATFDVNRGVPALPTPLVGALSSWPYHATVTAH